MKSKSWDPPAGVDRYDEFGSEAGWLSSKREVPAWAISMAVHVAILFVLFSITHVTHTQRDRIISTAFDELDLETFEFDVTVQDQVGNDSSANLLSPSQDAAQHVARDAQEETQQQLDDQMLTVDVPLTDNLPQPSKAELVNLVETSGGTEHIGGVEGAIDRLTLEIHASLRERKTLAIWLFDASRSVDVYREEIADRFENVYKQLDSFDVGDDRALKTAVVRFGKKTTIMTPEPVDDVKDVIEAVRNIEVDESGVENVWTAVSEASSRWLSYRTRMRRNIMMIIVTDERGDDPQDMERVIQRLKRHGIRVYCVGHAAVFGREETLVDYTDETGYTWTDLPMDQGPETVLPERLKLPFWGTSERDLKRLSSGFGPYALTRLCAETGGLYLIMDENDTRFDPAVMRDYRPDYRPRRDYESDLQKNAAKRALVTAALSTRVDEIPRPRLTFQADNDNTLRQEIDRAQRPAAQLDHRLNEMLNVLAQGEQDREKLETPRWRAGYDLAMGRVLAMRARAFGYNSVLAEMKVAPRSFEKKESNMWRLRPSSEVAGGPQVRKLASEATKYLTRVVDEHPGTPWALLAERELSEPMGWEWHEGTMTLSRGAMGQNDDPRLQLADDAEMEAEKKKMEAEKKKNPPVL